MARRVTKEVAVCERYGFGKALAIAVSNSKVLAFKGLHEPVVPEL